jgi:hypothetical protein
MSSNVAQSVALEPVRPTRMTCYVHYRYTPLNDRDSFQETSRQAISSLGERHRVTTTRLEQPLCMSLSQGITCSKWWNSNLIINWALLILFVFFPIVGIYRLLKVWMRLRNCIHHQLRYHVHNLSPPEYETDFSPYLRKTRTFPNLSAL